MKILQVSTVDIAGGAESIAWQLFQEYRHLGHHSWLAVGLKRCNDADVILIQHTRPRNPWTLLSAIIAARLKPLVGRIKGAGQFQQLVERLSDPLRLLRRELGHEDFDSPGARHLLDLIPERPSIIHCHNLHGWNVRGGGYFDLRVLPRLSQQVPMVLTLHDSWLFSGHCAHSFNCERWKAGCGSCPDLTVYPGIRRDATAYNWRRKREIYAKSRFYLATPCRWLMQKVEQSMLAIGMVEGRVIPNGVNLSVFHPGDRQTARTKLGISQSARVLLFAANGIRRNIWKDYQTMRAAIALVAEYLHRQSVLFIALGEDAPTERVGRAEVRFVPYQKDPRPVATYYQAADVYVHAAKADTFPNSILEALACGTPVVATAVGGISEQIEDGITGFLVPPGDPGAMADCIQRLLTDEVLQERISRQASESAGRCFDLNHQVDTYLAWYEEILKKHRD